MTTGQGADGRDLTAMRRNYDIGGIDDDAVSPDPFEQFARWFADAESAGVVEPNAMSLATATPNGIPSARTVLLKGFDQRGFVWFTNYESRKGRELEANPNAALVFRWQPIERQVCIGGTVERVRAEESDAYFASRPLGSRVSAAVSPQSRVVASRQVLEDAAAALLRDHPDGVGLERPLHWGGFRLTPLTIELWHGRPNRLHDRIRYRRDTPAHPWLIERLGP